MVEEIIKPQLDEKLRFKIFANLFTEWMRQQVEEVELVISLESNTASD
ncbi:hypothetical protein [aff. Roholtiella sp. LEGE 12411]|nr:hypothetical protein [aff. Roholtiella sp. LEGE 12411]MBE9037070.1 hypothetical protein [aff. Roholtiella sp. LEGE 12411]